MIEFHYETKFRIKEEGSYLQWVQAVISLWKSVPGALNFVFVSDERLLEMNRQFLGHDYFTDILTFENAEGDDLSGDIFISVDRVRENADLYGDGFEWELRRVMAHGLLHLLGFSDKSEAETKEMRKAEDLSLKLFHVEH